MKRVVVAMSGGVDSSVAAALLKESGHEVIGITMCFNLPDALTKKPSCCGIQAIEDARRVAHKLGIKHYVLNMQNAMDDYVIKDFCREYVKGRTPNPCIRCNQYIKFDILLKKAFSLGAEFLATGHYAKIVKKKNTYQLKKAKDLTKDQSYFLYRLGQQELKHTLFPLGDYSKKRVRELAREFRLPVAEKPDSQEICFLPDTDYRAFLKSRNGKIIKPGLIADTKGNVLGKHQGIAFYTIGQREGLGIALGYPVYVVKIDAKNNRIMVGSKEDAHRDEFFVKEIHFTAKPIKKAVAVCAKIRYNHKEEPCRVELSGRKLRVVLKKAQFAVTPGQSAVFYDKDTVLGGGIIDKVL